MSSLLRRRPSPAMIVALIALFVALDGPATAMRLIDGRSIRRNSITTRQIRDHTLRTSDLSKKTVAALKQTPANSVGTRQLRARAVDASKLAPGAVGSSAIAPKGVGADDLADGAVGPLQLATGAVTATKLADGSVGAGAVADGGLQARDVGDFYGVVSVDFGPFAADSCQVAKDITPQPSAPGQANVIADDAIAVSPAPGWPDPIVVHANPGAGNTLRIVACRIGSDGGTTIDPGPTNFQYVAFDEP